MTILKYSIYYLIFLIIGYPQDECNAPDATVLPLPLIVKKTITKFRSTFLIKYRGCVSMGAMGAMAPTNFQRVAFGTHEFLMSMHYGTYAFFCVTIIWHPHSQFPNAPSVINRIHLYLLVFTYLPIHIRVIVRNFKLWVLEFNFCQGITL